METNNNQIGNYWNSTGRLQTQYDELYNELVPTSGSATTIAGEMIRGISRVLYDYYNNGNFNIQERKEVMTECIECNGSGEIEEEEDRNTCYSCNGSGEVEEDVNITINNYYEEMISVIEDNGSDEIKAKTEEVRNFITTDLMYMKNDAIFSSKNELMYNSWADLVIEYVINNLEKLKSISYKSEL